MPFLVFRCNQCDFKGNDMVTWGPFSYLSGFKFIPLERQLGWCPDCAKFVPVEILPTSESLISGAAQVESLRNAVEARRKYEIPNRSWFKGLFKHTEMSHEFIMLKCDLHVCKQTLKQAKARAAALSGRSAKPKCLECGSINAYALTMTMQAAGDERNPAPAIPSGVLHPGCGGEFQVAHSDFWVNCVLPHRIYDTQGRFLRSEKQKR